MSGRVRQRDPRLARLLTVSLLVFCLAVPRAVRSGPAFPDTVGLAEEPHIARLKALGVILGDETGNFHPGGVFTRAAAATLAVRLCGLARHASSVEHPTRFPDVQERHRWAWGYINVAVAQGLVRGTPEGLFLPDEPITQLQAVVLFLNALGYTGMIQGGWPYGYIAKGIEVGLVTEGFDPERPATRAFVASVADRCLDREVVRETETGSGQYRGVGKSLYEQAFGGKLLGKTVQVRAVDRDTPALHLEDYDEPLPCAPGMVVYGKNGLEELVGHLIVGATNSLGQLVFVRVVTPEEVSGVVSFVNPEGKSIVVGGMSVAVSDDVYVEKNGVELVGTLAERLRAILSADARAYIREGKAYRIVARLFQKLAGVVSGRRVKFTPEGVELFISIDGKEHPVSSEATLIRNGRPAEFSEFLQGDPCLYAVEDGVVTYLDAWKMVKDSVLVVEEDQQNLLVTVQDEGLECSYRVRDISVLEDPDLEPGAYCTLLLGRDELIYDVLPPSSLPQLIATIRSTTVEMDGSSVAYTLVLEDGRSLRWTDADLKALAVYRNGRVVSAPPIIAAPPEAIWGMFVPGESLQLSYGADRKPAKAELFTPGRLQGVVFAATRGPVITCLQLRNAYDAIFAQLELDNSERVTLNGREDVASAIREGDVVRFAWDVSSGRATQVMVARFADLVPRAVAAVTRDDAGNIWFSTVRDVELRPASDDVLVLRDGRESSLEEVRVGDKVRYDAAGSFRYLEVYTDASAPRYRHAVAQWSQGAMTVQVWFDEEIWSLEASVDGVSRTFSRQDQEGTSWKWTSTTEYPQEPVSVTLSLVAKDYAGNVLSKKVTVPVTGPQSVELPGLVPPILPPF